MQAPTPFYGRYRDVSRAAKRIARRLTRGESLSALIPSWMDLRGATGLVLLDGSSALVGGSEHYHAFALTKALVESRLGQDREAWGRVWTEQSMKEPWSLLGLLGQYGQVVVQDDQRIDLLLRAVDHWDEFVALGDRWSLGLPWTQSFWSAAGGIKGSLARMGGDVLHAREPRTSTELRDMVHASSGYRIKRCLAAGLFAEALAVLEQQQRDSVLQKEQRLAVLDAEAALFVAVGRADLVAPVMRKALDLDPSGLAAGLAARWLAKHGSADGGDPVKDARESFLRGPDLDAWKRLKQAGGDAVAQDALAELLRRDESRALWVQIWDDDPRALQTWELLWQRGRDRGLLAFAAAHVARVIANENPTRAGELYLISAREHVGLRKPSAYRESASLVRKARDSYVAGGRPDLADACVERFRTEHRRFRRLMEALDKAGL
jgi:hypothetical protein